VIPQGHPAGLYGFCAPSYFIDGLHHEGGFIWMELGLDADQLSFTARLPDPALCRGDGPVILLCHGDAPTDPLELSRGAGLRGVEEFGLVVGGRDPRQRTDLRVADQALGQRLVDLRKAPEGSCDTDPLAGGAWRQAARPSEPMST